MQKNALTSVLEENGATLTEWLTDNIASATADFSVGPVESPSDLRRLEDLRHSKRVFDQLNTIDWAFSDDNTTYLSHDIHPYPAKFIPQIPRHVIARLTLPGETVWDPFGGSGTTALEAVLLGRQAISSDVNPLAQIIGKGKLLTLTKEDDDFLSAIIEDLFIVTSSEASSTDALNKSHLDDFIPDIPNLTDWFHPIAVKELAYIKARILAFNSEKCRTIADVCFSKIILKSSYQDSETRYARSQKDFPPGKVIRLFAGALESSLKKARYLGAFIRFREAAFLTADLRCDDVVKANSVDLIVTSPPYSNTNDYHLYHRFRLFWLGFDPRKLAKKEIGSHLRHQKEKSGIQEYLQEIQECLGHMFSGLRPGRFAVMVVGDSMFDGEVFHTASLISARAKAVGFEVIGEIERKLPKHRRSFMSTARRLKSESLLLLRKPHAPISISIFPPPYKLWPYESLLREAEVECLIRKPAKKTSHDLLTAEIDSLQIDKLRRLTFSHSFSATNFSEEQTWQAILENGDARKVSLRKDPKYVTHGIHSYKGKFYPQLARSLFNLAQLERGQTVLDPFCGSGTVPLEAYLNGLRGVGFDLNPLAVKIATAKTQVLEVDPYVRDRVLASFQHRVSGLIPSRTADVFQLETMKEIESWFPPKVILKLAAIIEAIKEVPEVRIKEFLEVLLSNIVREVSQQDPEDLRIRRRGTAIKDAPVLELFATRLTEQRRRLAEFASRSNRAPCKFLQSDVCQADSRDPRSFEAARLWADSVDAIITSPPYATALPYIDTDRLSILLLFGLQSSQRAPLEESLTGSREIRTKSRRQIELLIENKQFADIPSRQGREIISKIYTLNKNAEVGFRRKNLASLLYRYFSDMTQVMRNLEECLKVKGSAFFVIGNNTTVAGDQPLAIRSGEVLAETAQSIGWHLEKRIPITVTKEKRPHSRHAITENEIVWFMKKK